MLSSKASKRGNEDTAQGETTKRTRMEKVQLQLQPKLAEAVTKYLNDQAKHGDPSVIVIPGEFGITIPTVVYTWLMEAQTEKQWKGACRAAILHFLLQSRSFPRLVRVEIFEAILPPRFQKESNKFMTYLNTQFNVFFAFHKAEVTRYGKEFLRPTDAGRAVTKLYNDAIERKESNGIPDNFLHDVSCLETPGDILRFKGKDGLSCTKHNMVDVYRKQLGYFQNESDEEHQVGWFKEDRNNFFLRELSLSTLKDMIAIIRMELLPGCTNKNKNHTVYSNQVWKNRFSIPIGTIYPKLAGLEAPDGSGFFADNAPVKEVNGSCPNMAVPVSCFSDNEDDLDENMEHITQTVVMPPPTDHVSDADFEAHEDPQQMTREDAMVSDIANTRDIIEPDSIIAENDDFEKLVRRRGRKKEVDSCSKVVRQLDRKGVPHSFKDEGFDRMVDFFEKASVPLELYTTRLSNLYATANIYDQVRISSLQIAYRQDILAALSVKCDKELESLEQVRKDMMAKVEHMRNLEKKLMDTARAIDSTQRDVDEAARLLEKNKSSTKRMLEEESEYDDSDYEALAEDDELYIHKRASFSRTSRQQQDGVVDFRRVKDERDNVNAVNPSTSRIRSTPGPDLVTDPLLISRSSRYQSSYPASPIDASFATSGNNSVGNTPTANRRRSKQPHLPNYVPRVTRAATANREVGVSRHKAPILDERKNATDGNDHDLLSTEDGNLVDKHEDTGVEDTVSAPASMDNVTNREATVESTTIG